jgi:hypothetical protein
MANLGDACTHEELLSIYENGYTILRVRRLCIVVLCHPEADGAMGVLPRGAQGIIPPELCAEAKRIIQSDRASVAMAVRSFPRTPAHIM